MVTGFGAGGRSSDERGEGCLVMEVMEGEGFWDFGLSVGEGDLAWPGVLGVVFGAGV